MVTNVSLKCQPLALERKHNKSLSFGSDEKAKKTHDTPSVTAEKASITDISCANAAKNFYKGLVSPVISLLQKPVALAATAATSLGVMELAKKSKNFGILAVTATAGFGTFSIGKGLVKLVKGETVEAKEKGFQDMGTGTLTIGLAALSAKPALKANSQIKTPKPLDEMNPMSRLWTCIKESKNIVKNIFEKGINKGLGITKSASIVTADTSSATTDPSSVAASDSGKTVVDKVIKLSNDPTAAATFTADKTGAIEAGSNFHNGALVPDDYEVRAAS